jgi:hypothetical protein
MDNNSISSNNMTIQTEQTNHSEQIGLTITINYLLTYFKTDQIYLYCSSVEEAKLKMIEILANKFAQLYIDYPHDLNEFEFEWFNKQYVDSNCFYYKLCVIEPNHTLKWIEPWEYQELYLDILDHIQQIENSNPPKFEEIFGEPNPDESEPDKTNQDTYETDEKLVEFEQKLTNIITQSKTIPEIEDQVKECFCEKCICQLKEID